MDGTMERFTETVPGTLPMSPAEVIERTRERLAAGQDRAEVRAVLLETWPDLELLAPADVLAKWLGMQPQTITVARSRKRPDGSRLWPDPDTTVGPMWRFVTVLLDRASVPGRGWNLRDRTKAGAL